MDLAVRCLRKAAKLNHSHSLTSKLPYFSKNLKSWWMPASLSECKSSIPNKTVSGCLIFTMGIPWKVVFWYWDRFQFIDFLSFVAMTLHVIRIEGAICLATSDTQIVFKSTFGGDLDEDLYSAVHQLEELNKSGRTLIDFHKNTQCWL